MLWMLRRRLRLAREGACRAVASGLQDLRSLAASRLPLPKGRSGLCFQSGRECSANAGEQLRGSSLGLGGPLMFSGGALPLLHLAGAATVARTGDSEDFPLTSTAARPVRRLCALSAPQMAARGMGLERMLSGCGSTSGCGAGWMGLRPPPPGVTRLAGHRRRSGPSAGHTTFDHHWHLILGPSTTHHIAFQSDAVPAHHARE